MGLFGGRTVRCAVCSKELKHKYKPQAEWKIEGYLCSDCHIEKTKEFTGKPAKPETCAICGCDLGDIAIRPKWNWNMEPGSLLCQPCFSKKGAEHDKKLNYCAVCGIKMGFVRYNPKPAWKVEGQMCRKCWDGRNAK